MFDKFNGQELLLVQSSAVAIGLGMLLFIISYLRGKEGILSWTAATLFWGCAMTIFWLWVGENCTFRPNCELVLSSLCFFAVGVIISLAVIRREGRFWQMWFVPFAVLALNAATLLAAPFLPSLHLHLP